MADGKWIAGLTPEMPVADAARAVLAARFEVVRHYLPLAVEKPYEDPEYVHQLRVGTRRAGAALRVFADCLPTKHAEGGEAARSGRSAAPPATPATGTCSCSGCPTAEAARTAEPASRRSTSSLGYAIGERSAAQARLVQAAADGRPGVRDASGRPARPRPRPARRRPAAHVRRPRRRRSSADLLARFNAAVEANPTDPAALHQLRILGKRVRYALEIFADCFPPSLKDDALPRGRARAGSARRGAGRGGGPATGSTALRDRVKQVHPDEWPRLEAGFEGLIADSGRSDPGRAGGVPGVAEGVGEARSPALKLAAVAGDCRRREAHVDAPADRRGPTGGDRFRRAAAGASGARPGGRRRHDGAVPAAAAARRGLGKHASRNPAIGALLHPVRNASTASSENAFMTREIAAQPAMTRPIVQRGRQPAQPGDARCTAAGFVNCSSTDSTTRINCTRRSTW